ncbi:MAG: hypothetical protein WD941_08980 [Opitutus sp.]
MAGPAPTKFLIALAAFCLGCALHGQGVLQPSAGQSQPVRKDAAPKRPRAISPEVAAQLAANAPKYAPPRALPTPTPIEEQPDMRDIDKPRNTIIRLPSYIVREPKPAVLSERAVHTDKGLADIAVRRYISDFDRAMNRITLPLFGLSTEARAMAMYEEDERLTNMSELNENVRMISATDQAAGTYIKREVDKTYMRTGDFGWRGDSP